MMAPGKTIRNARPAGSLHRRWGWVYATGCGCWSCCARSGRRDRFGSRVGLGWVWLGDHCLVSGSSPHRGRAGWRRSTCGAALIPGRCWGGLDFLDGEGGAGTEFGFLCFCHQYSASSELAVWGWVGGETICAALVSRTIPLSLPQDNPHVGSVVCMEHGLGVVLLSREGHTRVKQSE